jgi:ATP-binding cassette subfamily B protein
MEYKNLDDKESHNDKKKNTGVFRLLEIAGSKKWYVIIACIIGFLAVFVQFVPYVLVYFGIMELVNNFGDLTAVDSSYMKTIALSIIGCFVGYAVFTYLSLIISHIAAFNILYEIRIKLAEKLSRLGWVISHIQQLELLSEF